jgi:hypothetical protein
MSPVISEQYTPIAAAVAGLRPMFPVIAELWLPVSVIPVVDEFDRITKLFVDIDLRSTGAGPEPAVPSPPHPAKIAASTNVVDHIIGFEILSNLFICYSYA